MTNDTVERILSDAHRGDDPNEIRARAAAVTCSDIDRQRLDAKLESMVPRRSGLLTLGGG
jgi:hypothetical protein